MGLGPYARVRAVVGRGVMNALRRAPLARDLIATKRAIDVRERGLDPEIACMLGLDDLVGDSRIWKRTPEEARRALRDSVALSEVRPADPLDVRDIMVAGAAGPLRARLYAPPGVKTPAPAMVFFHGGGWVTGDLETHDSLCRRFALTGAFRVIAVDYRLAPEHRFPAAAEDAVAAFRDIAKRAAELGIDPARIAVCGDSAGGNLSAVVGLQTRGDAVRPAVQVPMYAAFDARRTMPSHRVYAEGYFLNSRACDWYFGHYLSRDEEKLDPRISPLLEKDVSGAPPAIIVIAGFDVLRDEAEQYLAKLRDAGVPTKCLFYGSLIHGFALTTAISSASMSATLEIARATSAWLRDPPRADAGARAAVI